MPGDDALGRLGACAERLRRAPCVGEIFVKTFAMDEPHDGVEELLPDRRLDIGGTDLIEVGRCGRVDARA